MTPVIAQTILWAARVKPPQMRIWVSCSLVMLVGTAAADVRLPSIFTDHVVIQRDLPVSVWGWAEPREVVSVRIAKEVEVVRTGSDGKWKVTLKAQPMSTTPVKFTVEGKNKVTIQDALIGDVWLCSGQSNMEFTLGACNAPNDVAAANMPLVRQFGVEMNFASRPQEECRGNWAVCSPQTAAGFSAVAFYFAQEIHKQTGVPIGLMRSCVGGTNIELWMSQETLLSTPSLEPYAKIMRQSLDNYAKQLATVMPKFEAWSAEFKKANESKQPVTAPPDWPTFPFGEQLHNPRCVTLHNGMISPLIGYTMRGSIWYQGESNAGSVEDELQYVEKIKAKLQDWRKWFGNPDLPYYYVQLANWQAPNNDPAGGDSWANLREAQRLAMSIPHVGMASAIDVGEPGDIHPKNKADVGSRLARWALKNEYGKDIETCGPVFKKLTVVGSEARIEFDHVGSGLMVGMKKGRQPTQVDMDGTLKRFAIAGDDKKWVWANARIEGNVVICSHPDVLKPVAVRYAFCINPEGANLYNREGLPASPFRTDNW